MANNGEATMTVDEKLDVVLENQATILEVLEDVLERLNNLSLDDDGFGIFREES